MRVVVHLRGFITGLMLLCVVSVSAPTLARQEPSSSSSRVVIDGAKTPEKFPEWYRWETLFEVMAISGATPSTHPHFAQLKLSETDFALLLKELKRFQQSKELLWRQLESTKATLGAQGKSADEIVDASWEHQLTYRHGILDARARIHDALPPESLLQLQTWIDTRLATTKVFLSGRGLANFGKPW